VSKLYRTPVQARGSKNNGPPACFYWRGKWYRVESFSLVRLSLRNPWEPERWRVVTRCGGVFELARDGEGWVLWREWD